MRKLTGGWAKLLNVLVAGWSLFLLVTALYMALHPLLMGAISLIFGLAIVFLVYPLHPGKLEAKGGWGLLLFGSKRAPSLLDLGLIVVSVVPCIYIMADWESIVRSPGMYETHQLILGAGLVVCLLEGTRRALGNSIPILVLFFLCYALFGSYIPGSFGHAGFDLEEILYQLYLMSEGIWGLLTDMTSRLIALFVVFGPVLFATGVGKSFMDISLLLGGRLRGGAGHVAVISSSFFGMLSGSSVANAATTGSFTIPTMKRLGFPAPFAAGIEASASSGGQIMPPIMGAGCFIMAEFLNISYTKVMIAGLIPAVLYFVGISCGIWVEAGRHNLGKLPDLLRCILTKLVENICLNHFRRIVLSLKDLVIDLVTDIPFGTLCRSFGKSCKRLEGLSPHNHFKLIEEHNAGCQPFALRIDKGFRVSLRIQMSHHRISGTQINAHRRYIVIVCFHCCT